MSFIFLSWVFVQIALWLPKSASPGLVHGRRKRENSRKVTAFISFGCLFTCPQFEKCILFFKETNVPTYVRRKPTYKRTQNQRTNRRWLSLGERAFDCGKNVAKSECLRSIILSVFCTCLGHAKFRCSERTHGLSEPSGLPRRKPRGKTRGRCGWVVRTQLNKIKKEKWHLMDE